MQTDLISAIREEMMHLFLYDKKNMLDHRVTPLKRTESHACCGQLY